ANLRNMSIGNEFVLAVNDVGAVLAWGRNSYGQLGSISDIPEFLQPLRIVQGLPPVQAVIAGNGYSVAVDQSGQVFTWGANLQHQLGQDAVNDVLSFTSVALPEEIVAVETG